MKSNYHVCKNSVMDTKNIPLAFDEREICSRCN